MIWLIIVFGWLPIALVSMYLQWTEDMPQQKPQQPQQKSYRQIVAEVRKMDD